MMAKRRQAEKKKMGHCVGGCEVGVGGCGGVLEPPEFTPSGRQVTVQRGQWTRVQAEA